MSKQSEIICPNTKEQLELALQRIEVVITDLAIYDANLTMSGASVADEIILTKLIFSAKRLRLEIIKEIKLKIFH